MYMEDIMKRYIVNNGINFLTQSMSNTHSVTIALYILSGLGYENDEKLGISHLLEHLHFRELFDMSQRQLYYKMESLGTTLKGCTYADFMRFSLKILPINLRGAIEILKSIILTTTWSKESFLAEKEIVINQILNKERYLSLNKESKKFTLKNTPLQFGIMGEYATVKKLSLKQLSEYKRNSFIAENILFCMTGNFSDKEEKLAISMLEEIEVPKGDKNIWNLCIPGFQNRKDILNIINCDDEYYDVCLSFDIKYSDEISHDNIRILNCILGEGVGSKLQRRIREELGITSDIFSDVDSYANIAILNIKYTVSQSNYYKSLSEVLDVINDIKNNITLDDLKTALPFYKDNLLFINDDTEEMNFQLAYNLFVLDTIFKPSELNCDYNSTYRLMKIARDIFNIRNCTLTIIGDSSKISRKKIIRLLNQGLLKGDNVCNNKRD